MHCGLHIVPLVHFESVVGDGSREVSCGVSMQTIALWQLRLLVHTIWLHEGFDVTHWLLDLITYSIH